MTVSRQLHDNTKKKTPYQTLKAGIKILAPQPMPTHGPERSQIKAGHNTVIHT